MARGTVIRDAGMVENARGKATGFVTDAAILRGCNVIGFHAYGRHSVARRTVIHYAGMIKHRTNKRSGVMTDTAIFSCGNVRIRLANGRRAVVARSAIATNTRVVEYRGTKRCGGVTEITILISGQVVYGHLLTGSKLTVMTSIAAVAHAGMIKHTRGETAGDMAYGTILCGGDMICRFASGR